MIITKKEIPANCFLSTTLFFAVLMLVSIISVSAQTTPDNSNQPTAKIDEKINKIKDDINKIGKWGEITIIDTDSKEFYGSVLEINNDSVKIHDVDQKADIEIKYQRIKKVRKGYGDARGWSGKRIPNRRHILGLVIGAAAVIVIPIAILASSKD